MVKTALNPQQPGRILPVMELLFSKPECALDCTLPFLFLVLTGLVQVHLHCLLVP